MRTWRLAPWFLGCLISQAVVLSAQADSGALTDETYAAIQAAFLQEKFQTVVILAQHFLPRSPDGSLTLQGTRVWLWYVLSLEKLQRVGDALQELDRLKVHLAAANLAERDKQSLWPELYFWEGEISRQSFQLLRSRLAYQRVVTQLPNSPWRSQAQLGLGLVFFHQQAYDAAVQQFRAVSATSPSSALGQEAVLLEGVCDIQLKRFDAAVSLLQALLNQVDPSDQSRRAQVSFYLGEALTNLRQFEDAIQSYQQTIETDPESPWARLAQFGLGWSYFQQDRCRESLGAFTTYVAAEPRVATEQAAMTHGELELRTELRFAQGHCLMSLGDDANALARFEALRRDHPGHPLAFDAALSMSEILKRQQRAAEAQALLESLFHQSLESGQRQQVHLRLGSVYLAQGDPMKASAQFHLARESQDLELRQAAFNGLGDAQAALGNAEEAIRWYEGAARTTPGSRAGLYATYQLGRLKLQAGSVDEAIALFQRVANDSDQTLAADARLALAFGYLANAKLDLAQTELQRLQAQDPNTPHAARAGYYLALLALREGRLNEAKRLCEQVIGQIPQSDEALESRLLLADLIASQASPQEALATLNQFFQSLHNAPPVHRGKLAKKLGNLARQAGLYAQAIGWYEQAWEALPSQRGELDYQIASCYEEGGDLMVAAHRYREIDQTPWNIRGQLAAAKLMERDERWQEAMAIYTFVTRQPVPEAKLAQERLSVLERAIRIATQR